jgi:hypothetical protein
MNINLHQSRAGIGSKLNTHKLRLIIADNIIMNTIQADMEFEIKSTNHIGQLTCEIASCLSVSVFGLNIFHHNIHKAFRVSILWLYVSITPYFIDSRNQYLY